jgi:hypothetical protein
MSQTRDLERVVTDWLHADASTAGSDRVLSAVVERLAMTRQERRRILWQLPTFDRASRTMRFAIGAAAVITVIVAVGLGSRGDVRVAAPSSPPPSPGSSPTPSPRASAVEGDYGRLSPGQHDIGWLGGPADARIRVTIPTDGWSWVGPARSTIFKDHGLLFGFPADLETHTVRQVVTSLCALDGATGDVGPRFKDVGPTVDDLVSAVTAVADTSWSDPVDIVIGGHPGKRLITTHHAVCPGPARRTIWEDPTGSFFVEEGMRSTVDILDVDGDRLVLTENLRTADPTIVEELDAIVSSMEIVRDEPLVGQPTLPVYGWGRPFPRAVGPDADLRTGRHRAVIEGISFTFVVRESGWESQRGFYLSKSITGPQAAEGTIRWTTIPNGEDTDPCPTVLDDRQLRSAREVADAVGRAPGIQVLEYPMDVRIGGRPASQVVVRVESDRGCDPGYFYAYEPVDGGAFWLSTNAGDVIAIWTVEVDGKVLFIEAEATASAWPAMEASFRQMVESMTFE